jgi:hypothetical protein
MWTPQWLVREHLKTEKDLQTCKEARSKEAEVAEKKQRELDHREAALEEEKQARQAAREAVTALELQKKEAKDETASARNWIWGTGGAAFVATLIAVIQAI